MKPIAIFRHAPTEGPAYFATYLDSHGIPYRMVKVDAGEAVPADPRAFSGLAFMGGPMSVNDDLPWISHVLDLIRAARAADIPLLGHCLGGQLMSRALGGSVSRNPVKEIGWGEVTLAQGDEAQHWFGHAGDHFMSFHWHGETFTLPPGAVRVLGSAYCQNQAFALGDKHLGMQCHIEMTPELIDTWCRGGAAEMAESRDSPGVQPPDAIRAGIPAYIAALSHVADGVYDRWVQGLKA